MKAPGRSGARAGLVAALGVIPALLLGAMASSCSEEKLGAPRPGTGVPGQDPGLGIDVPTGPPPLDTEGLCGNELHRPVITDVPNLYFLIDASGSMGTPVQGGGTRYARVQDAAVDLVRRLGALINVGAALFPVGGGGDDGCAIGEQVLEVSPGDPYVKGQGKGPTTRAFEEALTIQPFGGTPTAATVEALTPGLAAIAGKTVVVLATDGGPNCNYEASCGASACIPYLEGSCDASCCAPGGLSGPSGCVDRADTVAAVATLSAMGVDVVVIGIPGSEVYGDVLDDMAVAGGAPRFVSPYYYKVDDLDALGGVLAEIAGGLISCTFALESAPPEAGQTNVYFDKEVLPYSEENGWRWLSEAEVELMGEACTRWKMGQVQEVQIVSGCPTEVAE
ncbi:vWA domain-containing protein [Chondromyces apiculatus]|uniref:CglB n=1 Tax=Chondromyces apiculatus DSM 436 TaxID=1192034 RepID=A0A017SWX1_9BACT|nr:vWA domain-containing protein [Chondromyces apiculatus]EYF00831.1 CglB [Chondromyces apiculatus DSM 436]